MGDKQDKEVQFRLAGKKEKKVKAPLPALSTTFSKYIQDVLGIKVNLTRYKVFLKLKSTSGTSDMQLDNIDQALGVIVCNNTELIGINVVKNKAGPLNFLKSMFKKKPEADRKKEMQQFGDTNGIVVVLTEKDVLMPNSLETRRSEKPKTAYFKEEHEEQNRPLKQLDFDGDLTSLASLKPVGIKNIGNTCYMAAALQLLLCCKDCIVPYLSGDIEHSINEHAVLGTRGVLTRAFGHFVQTYISTQIKKGAAISVRPFASAVRKNCPAFKTAGIQHDSHEFLMTLIDKLHEDTNKVWQKPIVDCSVKDYAGQTINEALLQQITASVKERDDSEIFNLFNSICISMVRCTECNTVSSSYQSQFSFILPIVSRDLQIPYVILPSNTMKQYIFGVVAVPNENVPFRRLLLEIKAQHPELAPIFNKLIGVRFTVPESLGDKKYHLPTICYSETDLSSASLFKNTVHGGARRILVISEVDDDPTDRHNYLCICNYNITKDKLHSEAPPNMLLQSLPFIISFNTREPTMAMVEEKCQRFLNYLSFVKDAKPKVRYCFLKDGKYKELDKRKNETLVIPGMSRDPADLRISHRASGRLDGTLRVVAKIKNEKCLDRQAMDAYHVSVLSELRNKIQSLEVTCPKEKRISVQECIVDSFKTQYLNGTEQYYCNNCKHHVDGLIDRVCVHYSKYLIMVMKRFRVANGYLGKDESEINVNLEINILENGQMVSYSLLASVIHLGRLSGGHYISYVRDLERNAWYLCNDDSVRICSDVDISASYILLYVRK